MNNRWLFIGEDARFHICQQLAEVDGKEVQRISETPYIDELVEVIEQFQPGHIVLPVQPLNILPASQVIPKHTRIYVGRGEDLVRSRFQQSVISYLQDEKFLVANANLTAEAWIHHFYKNGYGALYGKAFVVAGFGRVGQALAKRIRAHGSKVSILSAKVVERQKAKEDGYDAYSLTSTIDLSSQYLLNTIPFRWYTPNENRPIRLFDLASFPHCLTDANCFEYDTVLPTLPGKHFPIDAAKLLYRTLQQLA